MISKLQRKKEEGFTIIEVLIVLAIAGLIMLIVFLAVPALQRNSRNNARNSDASRVSAAVTECLANRNGQVASCNTAAAIQVGNTTQLETVVFGAGTATQNQARVIFNQTCTPDGQSPAPGTSSRQFAVVYQLEPTINRCIAS
jgi:prepilin-type N-terminal cleavage/methylation domain-containing protein